MQGNDPLRTENLENLYSEEISLLADKDLEAYIRLNLRRILAHRRRFDVPVIGIAGTEGKTTTKRMVSAILSRHYHVLETPPNCSSASGVTATLLKLNQTHEIVLLELNIVEARQFSLAVEVTEPNIAVVTNIGEAHLATLGDKYLIADAKTELVRRLPPHGCAILNIDDDLVSALASFAPSPRIIKFGLNPNAHFYANKIQYLGPDGIVFYVNGCYKFHLPIFSSTAIYNALTAISIARYLHLEFSEIKYALENKFTLPPRRGNLIRHDDIFVLDYTYDATVNSVNKACDSLVQFKPYSQKLILVIGDLTDPGPNVQQAHLKIGYYVAALPINVVIAVGENAKYIAEGVERMNYSQKRVVHFPDSAELEQRLPDFLSPQTTVLFIGKNELQLGEVVQSLFPPVPPE